LFCGRGTGVAGGGKDVASQFAFLLRLLGTTNTRGVLGRGGYKKEEASLNLQNLEGGALRWA